MARMNWREIKFWPPDLSSFALSHRAAWKVQDILLLGFCSIQCLYGQTKMDICADTADISLLFFFECANSIDSSWKIAKKKLIWGKSNCSEDMEYLMSEFWRPLILMGTQERLGKDLDFTLDRFCTTSKETCSFHRVQCTCNQKFSWKFKRKTLLPFLSKLKILQESRF